MEAGCRSRLILCNDPPLCPLAQPPQKALLLHYLWHVLSQCLGDVHAELEQGLHRLVDVMASVQTWLEVLLLDPIQSAVGVSAEGCRNCHISKNSALAYHLS